MPGHRVFLPAALYLPYLAQYVIVTVNQPNYPQILFRNDVEWNRAGNEPSRSLKFHNHREGLY